MFVCGSVAPVVVLSFLAAAHPNPGMKSASNNRQAFRPDGDFVFDCVGLLMMK
jgi:hypothetical protein